MSDETKEYQVSKKSLAYLDPKHLEDYNDLEKVDFKDAIVWFPAIDTNPQLQDEAKYLLTVGNGEKKESLFVQVKEKKYKIYRKFLGIRDQNKWPYLRKKIFSEEEKKQSIVILKGQPDEITKIINQDDKKESSISQFKLTFQILEQNIQAIEPPSNLQPEPIVEEIIQANELSSNRQPEPIVEEKIKIGLFKQESSQACCAWDTAQPSQLLYDPEDEENVIPFINKSKQIDTSSVENFIKSVSERYYINDGSDFPEEIAKFEEVLKYRLRYFVKRKQILLPKF